MIIKLSLVVSKKSYRIDFCHKRKLSIVFQTAITHVCTRAQGFSKQACVFDLIIFSLTSTPAFFTAQLDRMKSSSLPEAKR
jgi:hypothetical protein